MVDEAGRRTDTSETPEAATPLFTRVREDFTCMNCGREVRGNGYTNHCPQCLWSKHVDINPGDRLADCNGAMRPLAALQESDRVVIVHRCEACGFMRRNKASDSDDRTAILALFGRPVPDVPRKQQNSGSTDKTVQRRRARK